MILPAKKNSLFNFLFLRVEDGKGVILRKVWSQVGFFVDHQFTLILNS